MPNERLRDNIRPIIDRLIELRETTRPAGGSDTEADKLKKAGEAIDLLWTLADLLTGWAEAHLIGYSMVSTMPELAKFLEERMKIKIRPDSQSLEHIGNLFQGDPDLDHSEYPRPFSSTDDPEMEEDDGLALLDSFQEALYAYTERYSKKLRNGADEEPDLVSPAAFRALVSSMLGSPQANGNFWRNECQRALRKLDEGEIDPIFQPDKKGLWGQPFSLTEWKLQAIRQVVFRVGSGMKKYQAQKEVADALGQSEETLKKWEQGFLQDTSTAEDLACSKLAGKYDSSINAPGYTMSVSFRQFEKLETEHPAERVELLGAIIRGVSLEVIRANLMKFRTRL